MKEVEELYGKMLAVFEEKTGFTMDDTADLAVRLYAAAAQIQSLYAYSDWAMNQSFPQTATGEYLDYHAALRGITRKAGTRASGILRFKIDQALEDNLPISAARSARRRDWSGLSRRTMARLRRESCMPTFRRRRKA